MIYNDNCLTVLSTLPENSIDAILTDPPYGLSDHRQGDELGPKYFEMAKTRLSL